MERADLAAMCTGLGSVCEDEDGREFYVKNSECLGTWRGRKMSRREALQTGIVDIHTVHKIHIADGVKAAAMHDEVNLKHLQRFLRRDDPTNREIFMQLGKWNTIRQDILPIIVHYRDNYDLVLNAVKVMVFLTMPVDSSSTNIPQQLDYLRNFKAAVLEDDIAIGVVISHLQEPLEHMERYQSNPLQLVRREILHINWNISELLEAVRISGVLTDMDGKMFQLVLTLIRNFLAIDDSSSPFTRSAASSNSHATYLKDELLERLFKENVTDLLLALTQHVGGDLPFLREDNLLILEIFNHLIWGQLPNVIASSDDKLQKQKKSSRSSAAVIEALISHEREEKQRNFAGSRHSNFTGTFVRVEKDGTKTLLTRNPYQSPLDNLLQKPEIKRGQVKKVATDLPLWIPSNATVCGLLKSFADQFLEGSYNMLMETVKDDICSERNNVQPQDIVMYFSVANFFTAYQRCLLMGNQAIRSEGEKQIQSENVSLYESDGATFQGRCGRIASTMDEEMFTLVTRNWQSFVEAAKVTNDWFPPTTAGVLLKEMIHMLDYVLKAADRTTAEGQQEVRVARILLFKVFYDQTADGILPFIFRLIKTFDVHKQPRSQLAGLIETTHIVLRLLDSITKEDGALRVKKKARKIRKKGTTIPQKETARFVSEEKDDTDPPLSKSNVDPSVSGIKNSESELEVDEEGRNSESENQDNSKEPSTGVQATETDTQSAGDRNSKDSPDGVPVLDLGTEVDGSAEGSRVDKPKDLEDQLEEDKRESEADDDGSEEEEEGGGEGVRTKEETLDVLKCVKMLTDNTVLHNYCWLLKNYTHNTAATNYYIIRMLQRICQDCMMEPMLYQLSVLQTCYEILSNKSIPNSEQHQFVVAFLTKLVRHLFQKLKRSPILFVDLLFWKSKQDCHCITADYMLYDLKNSVNNDGKSVGKATDFQDRKALLDGLGDDDDGETESHANVPHVENLHNPNNGGPRMDGGERGRVKRQKASKRKRPFSDYEEDLIKEFFEKHKDNRSCSKLIAQGLAEAGAVQDTGNAFTPAQVGRALKRLGLERVVKKKTTNKVLESIRSDDECEKESEAEKESKASDVEKGSDGTNGRDEDEENVHCTKTGKNPSIMDVDSDEETLEKQSNVHAKVPAESEPTNGRMSLESMDSDNKKEESTKEASDGEGDTDRKGGVKSKSRKAIEKRASGDLRGNDDCTKRRRKSGLFSEAQDQQLQSLFGKYKGVTALKHLISNELEGLFTPIQIGRRLQQLGCVQPKKRISNFAQTLSDEDKNLQREADFHGSHGSDGERGGSQDAERDCSSDQRHASGEGLSAPSLSNSNKDKEAGIPCNGAFRASWGALARKSAQKKAEHPIIEQNRSGIQADGEEKKRLQPEETVVKRNTSEGYKSGHSESDDDQPIRFNSCLRRSLGKRKEQEVEDVPEKKDATDTDKSGDSDCDNSQQIEQKTSLKKTETRKNRLQPEDDLEKAHANESYRARGRDDAQTASSKKRFERKKRQPTKEESEEEDGNMSDKCGASSSDDDQLLSQALSLKKIFKRKKRRQLEDEPNKKDSSECDDDQPIGQTVTMKKTLKRMKRIQPEIYPEKLGSETNRYGSSDSEDNSPIGEKYALKKIYERKKRPQAVQKPGNMATWGDSDTDASDIK